MTATRETERKAAARCGASSVCVVGGSRIRVATRQVTEAKEAAEAHESNCSRKDAELVELRYVPSTWSVAAWRRDPLAALWLSGR